MAMPYMLVKKDSGWLVYKQGEDGHPMGDPHSMEPMPRKRAVAQMRALYAAERKKALPNSVSNILQSILHSEFTEAADTLFGMGYLNREQRIGLSNQISTLLNGFSDGIGETGGIMVAPDDVDELVCDDEDEMPMDSSGMGGMMDMGAMMGKAARSDVTEADKKRSVKEYGNVTYADPANKKYPIDTEEHIRAAWNYIHQEKNAAKYADHGAAIKRRIVAAWKDKIDKEGPPGADSAKGQLEDLLSVGVKALYDANASDYVWAGVSHNAWQDDQNDIIPLALIQDDIDFQKRLIQKGYASQFGEGLWIDHKPDPVIGDCLMREIVDGGRFCFEMGNINPLYKGMDGHQMSVTFNYTKKATGEYDWVYVKERSALDKLRRVNGRTFFTVKRRGLLKDATLGAVADEVTALLEDAE